MKWKRLALRNGKERFCAPVRRPLLTAAKENGFQPHFSLDLSEKNGVEPPKRERFFGSADLTICTAIEYCMLGGVNDAPEHAEALIALLRRHGLRAKLNLIPFNPFPQ
ncbi:MAG: hypothetical protein II045_07070, partial [Oscillospiraceae bacterium]|nr:hypothetical protein [Oscillospiraceae bacterium]